MSEGFVCGTRSRGGLSLGEYTHGTGGNCQVPSVDREPWLSGFLECGTEVCCWGRVRRAFSRGLILSVEGTAHREF